MPPPNEPAVLLGAALARTGIDLVTPFAVDGDACQLFPFERFGKSRTLGFLIGNTRALWAPFRKWTAEQSPLPPEPLDTYVETAVLQAVADLTTSSGSASAVYWSHRTDYPLGAGESGAIPVQRLARHIGFASLAPVQLSVHPVYGPWVSLRAVVCVDRPAPPSRAAPRDAPCDECPKPCQAPFALALARLQDRSAGSLASAVRSDWRGWLSVRQSCPVGGSSEYSEEQSEYHYLRDPALLRKSPSEALEMNCSEP
ncbi:MAG: hypothetical protein RJA70_192 [Pseudomonadota bacterium]|jgi:methylmalonic aciduria homocystinuria type C protein